MSLNVVERHCVITTSEAGANMNSEVIIKR